MSDLEPFVHGEEGTHSACKARIKKEGGKARCCYCVPHEGCGMEAKVTCTSMKCPERFSVCCGAISNNNPIYGKGMSKILFLCSKCGKEFIGGKCQMESQPKCNHEYEAGMVLAGKLNCKYCGLLKSTIDGTEESQPSSEECGKMILTPHYDNGHDGGRWCAEKKPCKYHDKPSSEWWEKEYEKKFDWIHTDMNEIHTRKELKEYIRNLVANERRKGYEVLQIILKKMGR